MSSLYDILQVSPEASQEIIRTTYQRLSTAIADADPDAETRRKALNEAFFTLSHPERRQRYDQRLSGNTIIYATEPEGRPTLKYLVLGLVACAAIFGYTRYNHTQELARLERERIAAEARQAELLAQKEREDRAAEAHRLQLEHAAEQQQRYAFVQAQRQADYNMRANAAADERSRREAERMEQQAQRQQQQAQQNEQREALRRLEREKALARQLEYENSRNRRMSP